LPSRKPFVRLEDIIENIERIQRYTAGYDFHRFGNDQQCQDAVERCLLRISEAARKLGSIVQSIAPEQQWSRIRATGNVLRHEYDTIDRAIIWRIVTEDLPPLRTPAEAALKQLGREKS
jgi:uncharacterized protein with HEPN domain